MNIYALDSNILIEMKNNYPIEYFPTLWNNLEVLVTNGRLKSIDVVYNELTNGRDFSEEWAKSHKDIFLPLEEQVVAETKSIVNNYPIIKLDNEKDQADPFLIGFAKVNKYCLLTEERRKQNKINIPYVCSSLGVECLTLFELMKQESWRF